MKKTPAKPTTAGNLEAKFDRGEEVLDYFDDRAAKAIPARNRAAAQYLVELPTEKVTVAREGSAVYATKGAVKSPTTRDYAKRNETSGSPHKGDFMDSKKGSNPFKGVAKEPDKRRK